MAIFGLCDSPERVKQQDKFSETQKKPIFVINHQISHKLKGWGP
jgi:hypothetical protein